MNYIKTIFVIAATLVSAVSFSQDKKFVNADQFPVYGKVMQETSARYERLAADLEGVTRDPVWNLGRNSSGLFIRFRSNSSSITARWSSTFCNDMNHMTQVGTRGLDIYTLYNGQWMFMGSARPQRHKVNEYVMVANMDKEEREYMLYLSLYDGVESLEIGIDEDAFIEQPAVDRPSRNKPVVAYGTSILQGGCANRPGMAHTNILARRLDREVINLGFSGNAMLDLEIAEYMAKVEDPGLFILDYAPNAWDYLIREKGEAFFRILRDAHPDVPVIFIEDVIFPHCIWDHKIREEVEGKNAAQKELFKKLKAAGEKNIYYIAAEGMIGNDNEATVDTYHFTDLGMTRYVDFIWPTVKKALKKSK